MTSCRRVVVPSCCEGAVTLLTRAVVSESSCPRRRGPSELEPGHPLDLRPLRFHLLERRVVDRASRAARSRRSSAVEARAELLVRLPQRRLRLDAQLARQVGDREEQVAHLLFGALAAFARRPRAAARRPPPRSCRPRPAVRAQSKPTAATRVPISWARSSAGSAFGTPRSSDRRSPASCLLARLDLLPLLEHLARRVDAAGRRRRRAGGGGPASSVIARSESATVNRPSSGSIWARNTPSKSRSPISPRSAS